MSDKADIPLGAMPVTKEELILIGTRLGILKTAILQVRNRVATGITDDNNELARKTMDDLLRAYDLQHRLALRLFAGQFLALGMTTEELAAGVAVEGAKFAEEYAKAAAADEAATGALFTGSDTLQ